MDADVGEVEEFAGASTDGRRVGISAFSEALVEHLSVGPVNAQPLAQCQTQEPHQNLGQPVRIQLKILGNDRRLTFCALLVGLVSARTVHLTHLAGAFCGPAKLAPNYRHLQRFFQYVRLDSDWLAITPVRLLCLAPSYLLCLDQTNWKVGCKDVNVLVLCIATRRARIPFFGKC